MANRVPPDTNGENVGDKLIERLLFEYLEKKYSISKDDILNLSKSRDEKSSSMPVSIIANSKLSGLEAIVKFLREHRNLSYIDIGVLLHRNPKTLAVTYNASLKKMPTQFSKNIDDDRTRIPFSAFSTGLSILESICTYLKSKNNSYATIAKMIGKDQRTVWTVCHRAESKSKIKTESKDNTGKSNIRKQRDNAAK